LDAEGRDTLSDPSSGVFNASLTEGLLFPDSFTSSLDLRFMSFDFNTSSLGLEVSSELLISALDFWISFDLSSSVFDLSRSVYDLSSRSAFDWLFSVEGLLRSGVDSLFCSY
jgi:hypothetical protein